MLIERCDRCPGQENLGDLLGYRLCEVCRFDVKEAIDKMVAAGREIMRAGRAKHGDRLEQVLELIDRHGYVTARLLAKFTGIQQRAANHYLHAISNKGRRHIMFIGKGKFVRSKPEDQEKTDAVA